MTSARALDLVAVDHRGILVLQHNGAVEMPRPVRLVVRDDLERTRLTVVFRIFLAIPLLLWVVLRGIAAFVVGFVNWLSVLVQGEVPDSLHDFVASYIRYTTQVSAYVFLAADPYPWFRVQHDYPIDVEIAPPVRQGRWGGFFRLVLALPTLLLATSLGGGLASGSSSQGTGAASSSGSEEAVWWNVSSVGGVAAVAALLAWFAILGAGARRAGCVTSPRSPSDTRHRRVHISSCSPRAIRPPIRSSPSRTRSFPGIPSAWS